MGDLTTIKPETVKKADAPLKQIFAEHPQPAVVTARDQLILQTIMAKQTQADLP